MLDESNEPSGVVLERGVPFSESLLWELQRKFFDNLGVNAWESQVPFYITSNPVIGNCYAEVVINFILDRVQQGNYTPDMPFYVMELGTGSGKFSYYCLRRIFELQQELKLTHVKICYVMTDFTASNLKFWQTHSRLLPYVENNQLDFAIFDLVSSDPITLVNQNIVLSQDTVKNPIMVLGNYIFDTIPHDVFRIEDGELLQATPVLTTTQSGITETQRSGLDLEQVDVSFEHTPTSDDHYGDPRLDNILQAYKTELEDSTFLFPIAGFRCLSNLMNISGQQLLLITTDKGYSHLFEIQGRSDPHVVTHGSFSMMVNFHAMGKFFEACGGNAWHQDIRESIKTSVFCVGDTFDKLTFASKTIRMLVDDFGPGDFFNFHTYLKENHENVDLETIVSHMYLCRWDPRIFNLFIEKIIEEIPSADETIVRALIEGIPKIEANVFHMPGIHETYFDLAIFCHAIERFSEALAYYEKAVSLYGKQFNVIYNIALCHYFMGDLKQALSQFKAAKKLNRDSEETAEWITRVKQEIRGR